MSIDQKPWYKSKAAVGGIVAVLAGVAGVFGFDVPADVQAEIIGSISAIIGGVAGLAFAVGRIERKK